jgi:hypothetical protein
VGCSDEVQFGKLVADETDKRGKVIRHRLPEVDLSLSETLI